MFYQVVARRKENARREKLVDEFIARFSTEYSREPSQQEIIENLQDDLNVEIIENILRKKRDVVINVSE